jgi:hypothetical protein
MQEYFTNGNCVILNTVLTDWMIQLLLTFTKCLTVGMPGGGCYRGVSCTFLFGSWKVYFIYMKKILMK